MSHGGPGAAPPVFYDASGKRLRRIVTVLTVCIVLISVIIGWIAPQAVEPLWVKNYASANTPLDTLTIDRELRDIPAIGWSGSQSLARIDHVMEKNGKTLLVDPFSGKVFREANADEKETIGKRRFALEHYGQPADKQLILTFDDGPDMRNTPQILDILSREHVQATFFVVGAQVVQYSELFTREIREGHVTGNHTLTHTGFGNDAFRNREELIGADRIMRAVGRYTTRYFRIPEGDPDGNARVVFEAQRLGYLCFDMDYDPKDWSYTPGQTVKPPELDGKGHVVLLHDGGGDRSATVSFLPKFIQEARQKGYTFVTPMAMVPREYWPTKNIIPTVADRATWAISWGIISFPPELVKLLLGFGVLSVINMALYVGLAVRQYRRVTKRTFRDSGCTLPKVSVAVPVHNEQACIQTTLDALMQSDYPKKKMEIVVVDDGSTDNTRSIVSQYIRSHSWENGFAIRLLRQRNRGKWAALNRAFMKSSSKVMVTLDGDTVFMPQTVRCLARHFTDKNIGAVAGYVKVGNRRNLLTVWQSLEYALGTGIHRMAGSMVNGIVITPGACSAWRRDETLKAGGFSPDTMAEDCDTTLALRKRGFRIIQDSEATALTEAPSTLLTLARQRKRWMYGNFQAFYKHRGMIFQPKYGWLGMVMLPYSILSILVPLIFMPAAYVILVANILSGNGMPILIFTAVVTGVYFIMTFVALVAVRERMWHLLVIPIYRFIYEPLRIYLLYAAFFMALGGRAAKWYTPPRQGMAFAAGMRKQVRYD